MKQTSIEDTKNMEHTQGKWIVNEKGAVQVEPENPLRTLTVCQVYGGDDEAKANAKLIAAAPQLLAAVIALLEENEHLELDLNGVELGEAAIKAATE